MGKNMKVIFMVFFIFLLASIEAQSIISYGPHNDMLMDGGHIEDLDRIEKVAREREVQLEKLSKSDRQISDKPQLSSEDVQRLKKSLMELNELKRESLVLKKKREEYYIYMYNHKKNVFNFQYKSGFLIFFLVNLITGIGLWMSYKQFTKEINISKNSKDRLNDNLEMTEIELSIESLKLKSSTIGLIILVISLAFYFLYLKFVFPISYV